MASENPFLSSLSSGAPALAREIAAPLLGQGSPSPSGPLGRVAALHPDDRPAYLMGSGLSADRVASAMGVIDAWLGELGPALEDLADRAVAAAEGPDWIVERLLRDGPLGRLGGLLEERSLPVSELLGCALCAAVELAVSVWWLRRMDDRGAPAPGPGDARWADEDERIALLGLADEIWEWPV